MDSNTKLKELLSYSDEMLLKKLYEETGLKLENTPFWLEFLRLVNEKHTDNIFLVKKSAQVGATTFFTFLMLVYFLRYRMPCLFVTINQEKTKYISSILRKFLNALKIDTIITTPDCVISDIGAFYFAYTTTANSFRGKPACFIFIDEVAAMPHNIGGEGDVASLCFTRANTYSNIAKIFMFSTPTEDDNIFEGYVQQARQHYYYTISCPHCGNRFRPELIHLKEDEKFSCPQCLLEFERLDSIRKTGKFEEYSKQESNYQSVVFNINSLVSPLTTSEYILSNHNRMKDQDITEKTFRNLYLGEATSFNAIFPEIKLTDVLVTEYEKKIVVCDPHGNSFYLTEIAVKDGINYVTNTMILTPPDFKKYLETAEVITFLDIGFFSQELFQKTFTREEIRKIKLVRGANNIGRKNRQCCEIKDATWTTFYSIDRQISLSLIYRMLEDGKLFVCKHLPSEHISMIRRSFKKIKVHVSRNGNKNWVVEDYEHDCTHFQDCIIYAIGLLTKTYSAPIETSVIKYDSYDRYLMNKEKNKLNNLDNSEKKKRIQFIYYV